MSKNGNYTAGLLAGVIIGGAVGAITALLFAPKTGAELRQDIKDRSVDAYGKATDTIADLDVRANVSSKINEGRDRAENIINSAKSQAQDILENANSMLAEAKAKAVNAKNSASETVGTIKDATRAGADAFREEMNRG
jgi:gas vesicle protein